MSAGLRLKLPPDDVKVTVCDPPLNTAAAGVAVGVAVPEGVGVAVPAGVGVAVDAGVGVAVALALGAGVGVVELDGVMPPPPPPQAASNAVPAKVKSTKTREAIKLSPSQ